MYVPKINEMTDIHEITGFMKRFSFATIVSVQDGVPVATHLPFVIGVNDNETKHNNFHLAGGCISGVPFDQKNRCESSKQKIYTNEIKLYSHFAKANPQWKDIEANKVLVIFSEPHAYISPAHYDQFLSVPTWNYIAVHVYGKVEIIREENDVIQLLENTIDNYESSYRSQWNQLPQGFKEKMLKGIVAFEVKISDIQAKKKLSQNKTKQEQERIIDTLSKSTDGNEKLIADYMNKML